MFVDQEQQSQSEPTTQTKKKRRKPRKMGWKGFSLQGETHSDVE